MIHLDHNHSSSIPGPSAKPQNIILPNSPHSDQHPILQHWQPSSRDAPARPFYQESQEQFLSDTNKPPAQTDNSSSDPLSAPSALTAPPPPGPVTPGDAEDPSLPEPSPSSPHDARSPPADSSSSLTPPPDAASPRNTMDAPDDPPGQATTAVDGAEDAAKSGEQAADEVDRASRQSTPLSELSSAPETAPDDEAAAADGQPSATNGDVGSKDKAEGQGNASTSTKDSGSQQQHPAGVSPNQTLSAAVKGQVDNTTELGHDVDGMVHNPMNISRNKPILRDAPFNMPAQTGVPMKKSQSDPKVVNILELNSLLLRVSMEFQAQGIPMSDTIFNQYATRLQSNLTWLAAAADDNHKLSPTMILPIMQAPPVIKFPDMDRILHLYQELPAAFQKEIARRQQLGGMNGNAKRERTEEPGQDLMHKRRDTGETKVQLSGSFVSMSEGTSTPHPPSQGMPGVPNASISVGSVPRIGSPAMPPPPVPSAPQMGATDAQIAAARRQAQIRAMQQQQQQQMLHADGARQMSPPSSVPPSMSMQNVAGPSSIQNSNPQTMQNFQMLQNPSHPFMQFMVQQVPNFMQLPIPERLQRMQHAQQNIMRHRAQAQASGSMGGMQGGMMVQHSGDGSPSRMSPVSQQSPMQPGFPQGNPMGDPRAMMSQQQQQAFANMTPQQQQQHRQLYMLQQQQQMMRGGGGGGGGINPQMLMRLEQQRMAQAQAAQQGSPTNTMGSPMVDSPQFPALRSNPGMPGIARSARTPSDSVPSPVSAHRLSMSGQSPDEQQQRAMMLMQQQQQQQQQQRGMASQMQGGGFGGAGGMTNPAYAAQMQQMGMGGGGGGQNPNAFGMASPPGSAGGMGGGGSGYGGGSPAAGTPGPMWGQGGGGGQGFNAGGPFMAPSPSASQHDGMTPGRQMSATPAPHQMAATGGDQGGLMDFLNWGQS